MQANVNNLPRQAYLSELAGVPEHLLITGQKGIVLDPLDMCSDAELQATAAALFEQLCDFNQKYTKETITPEARAEYAKLERHFMSLQGALHRRGLPNALGED